MAAAKAASGGAVPVDPHGIAALVAADADAFGAPRDLLLQDFLARPIMLGERGQITTQPDDLPPATPTPTSSMNGVTFEA